jgi:membrane-associated protease RseP (regulator of RpoE activity)
MKEILMRLGLKLSLAAAACGALASLPTLAWAQAVQEPIPVEVVVTSDDAASTDDQVAADQPVEAPASADATASRLLLQLADQRVPQILVGPQQQQLRIVRQFGQMPARIVAHPASAAWVHDGLQWMVLPAEPPRLHGVRVLNLLAGDDANGAYAYLVDDLSEPQATDDGIVAQWEPGEYMIGVSLSEIDSDLLRQHLGIDDGVGLVVDEVFEDSPAQAAGITVGDIILKVGETDVKTAQELVDAVQSYSADSSTALSLELIQAGQRKTIEVTPTTRQEVLGYDLEVQPEVNSLVWEALLMPQGEQQQQFDQIMVVPHIAQWHPQQNDLAASIQNLSEQVSRLQEAIDRLEQRLDDE